MTAKKPVVLAIMDGFGIREEPGGNAISAAYTPNLIRLFDRWPITYLSASGEDVGLPAGQMGNSEVGHANMGAGRIVYQDLSRINRAVDSGDFNKNPALCEACDRVASSGGALHLLGLLSDGGVHSHVRHIETMSRLAKARGVRRLYLHMFTDGRDVSPSSGAGFVAGMQNFLDGLGLGQIATLSGRYYAMDRDKRWTRTEAAYRCMTEFPEVWVAPTEVVEGSYAEGISDEFIKPMACFGGGRIETGDTVVAINFRPDRMRQMIHALADPDFEGFPRILIPDLHVVTLTEYEEGMSFVTIAFGPEAIADTLGDVVEAAGLPQLRVAETEKYAHVTFFFDGGSETTRPHEKRILIPSPQVATYDLAPGMKAVEITDAVLEDITSYNFILLNYANCDMVGHTGVFSAAVRAVETVDAEVGRLCEAVLAAGGMVLLTADHGNAEEMLAGDGGPMTAHTTNLVPFCIVGSEVPLRSGGILADIAPTVLDCMGLLQPSAMTGRSLMLSL